MDILMNQLRMRLVWKENDESDPSVTSDYIPTGDTFNETTFADWNTGERNLCLKVLMQKAVYPSSGDPYYRYTMLDDTTIVNYTVNEGGTDGFAIGSAIASSYTLTLDNSAHTYRPSDFTNTRFAAAIGISIEGHDGIDYEPLGVWSVVDVDCAEQSSVATIQGMDMLGFNYDNTFWPFTGDDAAIEIDYGSISGMMDAITQVWSDIPWGLNIDDNGNVIADPVDYPLFDWSVPYPHYPSRVTSILNGTVPQRLYLAAAKAGITRRQVISWVATLIGTYVRMDRDGRLILDNYYFQPRNSATYDVYPATYYSYTPDGVEQFQNNHVVVWYYTDDTMEETKRYPSDITGFKPTNTIEVGANPLITSTDQCYYIGVLVIGSVITFVKAMTVSFVGAPQIKEGKAFDLHYMRGNSSSESYYSYCLPTRITATYDGGFSMTVESKYPSDNTAYSSSFNSSTTLLTYTKELAYGRSNQAAYSTDEQVTGQRWIDGKPIYRKVITWSDTLAATTTIGPYPSDLDVLVRCDVISELSSATRPVPFVYHGNSNYDTNWYLQESTGNIVMQCGSSVRVAATVHFILEYTKTTD